MRKVYQTPVSHPSQSWQFAQWDNEMAAMEEKYRNYAGPPPAKSEAKPLRDVAPLRSDYDAALSDLGAVIEAGDADEELAGIDAEMNDVETLRSLRESTYVRHVKNRSGDIVDEDAFRRGYEAREQLRDDTLDIAFKLHSVGRKAFADKDNPVAFVVCPMTGRFHVLPNVMGRKIFPTVAAQKRSKMVAALELLLRQKGHKFDQFVTFTWGKRCTVRKLRGVFKRMHRRISKLNSEPFMKQYGASFIFRASEIGGLLGKDGELIRDENGEITFHPHAHVLMHLDHWLPPKKMAALTKQIDRFWGGAWWQIDGAIEKVREACKYCAKPADLRKMNGFELVELDDALFRLHLVQPLGELREQIAARREACLTIKRETRVVVEDGQKVRRCVPVVMPDWNARKRNRLPDPKVKERAARRAKYRNCVERHKANPDKAQYLGMEWRQGDLFRSHDNLLTWNPYEAETAKEKPFKHKPVIRNRVIARLSPAPYFDRVVSPALLVWNFDAEGLEEINALPFVRDAVEAVREKVEASRARALRDGGPKMSVHVSAVTVRPRERDSFSPPLPRTHEPAFSS